MMAAMKFCATRLRNRRAVAFAADRVPEQCPNCSKQLDASIESFLLLNREGEKTMVSGEGRFCPGCDVVVLDADHFREMARLGLENTRQFSIAGFVDLNAVPEDKRCLHLGADDKPDPIRRVCVVRVA